MQKIYKKLTKKQIKRGVIFSSCLSKCRTEQEEDNIHEVLKGSDDINNHIRRLKDDSFFNGSPWRYNIIRS